MLKFERRVPVIFILFALILNSLASDGIQATKSLANPFINGEEIQISKYPFIVSVRRKSCPQCPYEYHCSGSIFNKDVIITAASCLRGAQARDFHVVAGSSLLSYPLQDGGLIFPVESFTLHPKNIDLAIIRLSIEMPLNKTLAIGVATFASDNPKVGASAVVVGWRNNGDSDEHLREARVAILEHGKCPNLLEQEICVGHSSGSAGVCNGDSGRPLVVDGNLVGLLKVNNECEPSDNGGVYTNLVMLKEWIVSQALGVHTAFL